MLDDLKNAGIAGMMQNFQPSNLDPVREAASMAVEIEGQQARALNDALEQTDRDERFTHNPEHRTNVLLGAVDAVTDGTLAEWYLMALSPVENADDAMQYVGIDGDTWRETVEAWYASAYGRGLVDEPLADADRAALGQVADKVVQNRYGVSLREFVAVVVTWDDAEMLERIVAGPMLSHTEVIRDLGDRLAAKNERIEELEAQIDD